MNDPDIDEILARHTGRKGALLPILHDIMAASGHVSEAAIRAIAAARNLSRAEVYGVVGFYHDFRHEPRDRPVIRLCRAESCQARGSEALAAGVAEERRVSFESVFCLGLCSVGPNAMVGDAVHARLDAARLAALVESVA